MKYSVISSFLGSSRDRFHEYNKPLTLAEKFEAASQIEGNNAVECVFPYEASDVEETLALMKKYNLGISAVNVNIKAEPEFKMGGITSEDPAVRAKAISFMKKGKEFAKALGTDRIQVCPLGDGYEFGFEADYGKTWQYLIEAFTEAADYLPEITTYIEYKPSETRGKCFLDTAAKTALLIKETGRKNIGVTLDFGHSVYGGNNPAEELSLLHSTGIPYYIHINDNDGKWDWDYFTASKHVIEYLEFVYYLRKFGYDGYLVSDTSPTRTGIRSTFEANVRITEKFIAIADSLSFEEAKKSGDYMDIWHEVENKLFRG